MAKLGAKIETIKEYKSGIEVNIYLDKKKMEFGAEFADFRVVSKDGDKVRNDILAAIRERSELSWTPIIRAEQEYVNPHAQAHSWHNGSIKLDAKECGEKMGLTIERFYVARKMDGSWVRVDWDMEPRSRMINAQSWYGDLPKGATEITYSSAIGEQWFDRKKIQGKFIMPYSASLWEGLTEVLVKMKMIRELVSGLLGSEEGMQKLMVIGAGDEGLFLGSGE